MLANSPISVAIMRPLRGNLGEMKLHASIRTKRHHVRLAAEAEAEAPLPAALWLLCEGLLVPGRRQIERLRY